MENKKTGCTGFTLKLVGMLLLAIGYSTPGLWPYQLPCCALGGILIGIS